MAERRCRECGCTDLDCRWCIKKTGAPCYWRHDLETDEGLICSACAPRKALSVRQPWAWLIVHGLKDIENRGWASSHRGELLIHAAQAFDMDAWRWIRNRYPDVQMPDRNHFELGGIVGRVNLIDAVRSHDSRWFFGPVGLVLADAMPLPFVAGRGMPGVFDFVPAVEDPHA